MRAGAWIIFGAIAVGVATASGASGASGAAKQEAPTASCGHVEELAAAKRALERGDSEEAARHLRNADALLSRCLRDGIPAEPVGAHELAETQTG